jgi:hypothetical protein
MTYRQGLCRRDRALWSILAVICFFLLYNEAYERVTGECGRWWNFNQKDSEFWEGL